MKDTPDARRALADVIKRWNALPIRWGVVPDAARDEAWTHLCRCADNEAHAVAIINHIADAADAYVPRFAEVAEAADKVRPDRSSAQLPKWETPPPMTAEERAEIRSLCKQVEKAAKQAKRVPRARGIDPIDGEEYTPEGVATSHRVVNGKAAQLRKQAELLELERRFGKINPSGESTT